MAIESIIGLGMLIITGIGYLTSYAVSRINWPLVWFCMRKDV